MSETIKEITPENIRAIRLAGLASDPQAFGGSIAEELERKEPEWRERLESPDMFFFAVEDDGGRATP